jgi:beta-phosphoglucomutase-like phosphatase (HAD superfamily)
LTKSRLTAAIFDVDGVLLALPHEQARRGALFGLADPARSTTAMYQAKVAGKRRNSDALAALQAPGVAETGGKADAYPARNRARLEAMIADGQVDAFPHALRLVATFSVLGWPMAVASSSNNARGRLRQARCADGRGLLGLLEVNVCGRNLPRGGSRPENFQVAAKEPNKILGECFVAEAAPAGIEAARAGGMVALGVAWLNDQAGLRAARADLVVTTLDDVSLTALSDRRLGTAS